MFHVRIMTGILYGVVIIVSTCTPSSAAASVPTPPVRPTYRDVSIKKPTVNFYQWFRGRTATQVVRDAMEETLTGIAVPEAIRYARTVPACAGQTRSFVALLSLVTAKLGTVYEQHSLLPAGSWFVPTQGRHYSVEQYLLRAIRACSLAANGGASCASSSLMTPSLADLLDIRIENGRCVAGATDFSETAPVEAYNAYRAAAGTVDSRVRMVPPDQNHLHATHAAHLAVSDFRCGLGHEPAPGVVQTAHLALEATARTEAEHHFLRLKAFTGVADGTWTREEVCKWARIQDAAHARWMEAVSRGDWGHARQADDDHQLAHICMTLYDRGLLVRFSCNDVSSTCPVLTCQQVLNGR